MIENKTFAEWTGVDPGLAEHLAAFRQAYGMRAEQSMDIATVNMRLSAIGINYKTVLDAEGKAVLPEAPPAAESAEGEFLGDVSATDQKEQQTADEDAEIERQLLAEEAAKAAAPVTTSKKR